MATTLVKACIELEHTISTLKAIHYLILKPDFEKLFNQASDSEKQKVLAYINDRDLRRLKLWYHTNPQRDLTELQVRELIEIAKKMHIYLYSRLTRWELIKEIRRKEYEKGRSTRTNKEADRGNEPNPH